MSELGDIKKILQDQSKAFESLEERNEKVDEIHFAIYGNVHAGVKGMAAVQKDHGKVIDEYNKVKYLIAGASVPGWFGFIAWIKTQLGI